MRASAAARTDPLVKAAPATPAAHAPLRTLAAILAKAMLAAPVAAAAAPRPAAKDPALIFLARMVATTTRAPTGTMTGAMTAPMMAATSAMRTVSTLHMSIPFHGWLASVFLIR